MPLPQPPTMLSKDELLQQFPNAFQQVERKIQADEKKQAWLKQRRGRITSSQLHKLFTSKYQTADNATSSLYINECLSEKLGSYKHEFWSKATQWGNDQEGPAIEFYKKITGNQVKNCMEKIGEEWVNNQGFIPYGEFCGGTPDGLKVNKSVFGTLQVKAPYNPGIHTKYMLYKDWKDFKANEKEYYCQIQSELLFAKNVHQEINHCDFFSFDPRQEDPDLRGVLIRIPIDESFQRILKAQLENAAATLKERYQFIMKRKSKVA